MREKFAVEGASKLETGREGERERKDQEREREFRVIGLKMNVESI